MAKFCRDCGAALEEGARFCRFCGATVEQAEQPAQPEQVQQPEQMQQQQPEQPQQFYAPPQPQQQNTQPPQPQQQSGYTPRPNVYIPEEFLRKNEARKQAAAKKGVPQYQQPYGHPQYDQPQYDQPQYDQPQYSQPQQPQFEQPAATQFEQPAAPQFEQPAPQNPIPPYRQATRGEPQYAQPQYVQNTGYAPRKKKSAKGILIAVVAVLLVVVFLFTGLVAPGFLKGGEGGGGGGGGETSKPPAVKNTEEATLSAEKPAVTLCGVTVDVIPEMLGNGSRSISVSQLETTTEDGVRCENYDLEMNDHRKFDIPVEVTFPCSVSGDYDPTVEHYNEDTGMWEPLLSFVDESKGTVTAYFGSFCPVRVSYLPKGANPKIYNVITDPNNQFAPKIGLAGNYWKILQRINPEVYGDEVNKFINNPENYAVDFPKLDENMDAKAAYEAFSKSSQMWTFIDPIINLSINELPSQGQNAFVKFIADNAESLGNAMNVIPFIVMGAQAAFDLSSGDPDAEKTAAVNLYKNLITSSGTIYSLTTGYSHIGFTLAFFGVALFGMELDYLVDAAKAEQKANVKSVFESYYTNTAPFDAIHWYNVFEKAYWDNDGDAEAAMKSVKEAVDAYCTQFWTTIYSDEGSDAFWEALSDSEYRKIFMNATEEDKAALTEQQKARVWDLIQKHSMKIIRRFLYERLQEDTRKELYAFIEPYNKERTITIKETVNRGAEAELTGYTVCFGYGNDLVPYPGWHVNIPDDGEYTDGWQIDFDYTAYGFMQMGLPDRVMFYLDEEDFNEAVRTGGKGERPSYTYPCVVDIKSRDPGTLVEINFGDPYQAKSDSFTGYTWNSLGYGGEISASTVNSAIEKALRNMTFKLDKDGNFNASSSGSYSDSGSGTPGPNDTYSYNASASVSLKGHIDKGTGDGTFEVNISVSYNHRRGSPYDGYDSVGATITIKGGGDITGDIDSDDTFDPRFGGDVTVHRQGSWSHSKGTAQWDQDGHETINKTEEYYCKMVFLANN